MIPLPRQGPAPHASREPSQLCTARLRCCPSSEDRKLRLREDECLPQGHSAVASPGFKPSVAGLPSPPPAVRLGVLGVRAFGQSTRLPPKGALSWSCWGRSRLSPIPRESLAWGGYRQGDSIQQDSTGSESL